MHISMLLVRTNEVYFHAIPLLAAKIPGFKPIPMMIDGKPNLSVTLIPSTGNH
jgi:hypothetical protein